MLDDGSGLTTNFDLFKWHVNAECRFTTITETMTKHKDGGEKQN